MTTALVAIRCFGAQDDIGPVCDGPDVRRVIARETPSSEPFTTLWCIDCRHTAILDFGYDILRTEPNV